MTSKNLAGYRFGAVTVDAGTEPRNRFGSIIWQCTCACGNAIEVKDVDLIRRRVTHCGCGTVVTTHHEAHRPIYKRWAAMLQRTGNPLNPDYKNYGGRGIKVCDAWQSYEQFKADMEPTFLPTLEIDRINVNGNYEPGNCRWLDKRGQARNRRTNHKVTIGNTTKTIVEWSEDCGVKPATILSRISRGITGERLIQPVEK